MTGNETASNTIASKSAKATRRNRIVETRDMASPGKDRALYGALVLTRMSWASCPTGLPEIRTLADRKRCRAVGCGAQPVVTTGYTSRRSALQFGVAPLVCKHASPRGDRRFSLSECVLLDLPTVAPVGHTRGETYEIDPRPIFQVHEERRYRHSQDVCANPARTAPGATRRRSVAEGAVDQTPAKRVGLTLH